MRGCIVSIGIGSIGSVGPQELGNGKLAMEGKVDPVIGVLTKGLGLIELIVVKRSLGGRTTINQA